MSKAYRCFNGKSTSHKADEIATEFKLLNLKKLQTQYLSKTSFDYVSEIATNQNKLLHTTK